MLRDASCRAARRIGSERIALAKELHTTRASNHNWFLNFCCSAASGAPFHRLTRSNAACDYRMAISQRRSAASYFNVRARPGMQTWPGRCLKGAPGHGHVAGALAGTFLRALQAPWRRWNRRKSTPWRRPCHGDGARDAAVAYGSCIQQSNKL